MLEEDSALELQESPRNKMLRITCKKQKIDGSAN